MNKLITLILIASCFGILGMGENGEAKLSGSDFFCKGNVCATGNDWCSGNTSSDSVNLLINYKYENGEYKNRECNDRVFTNLCYTTANNKSSLTGKQVNISCYKTEDKCVVFIIKEKSESCTDKCCKLKGSGYSCVDGECTIDDSTPVVFPATNCESKNDQMCCDTSKDPYACENVITSSPNKCPDGSTCCKVGSCQIASAVPMLPTNANTTPTTPTSSTTIQEPTSSSGGSMVNLSDKPLSEILEDLIKWLLKIVILIAILMIIISGVLYMISAGDQQKADTAKKALTYAILGLLVTALAYAIVNTLVDILAG